MYRDFYHLEYVPFTETPDSDLADLSRRHQAVLERVVQGLNKQHSLVVLVGAAGIGKVALLRSALATYRDPKCKTISIDIRKIHFQNQIFFKDIVKAVFQEIGYEIKYQISPDTLIDLHDIFIEEREKNSHLVIIIDHAHLLPHEVLKSVSKLIDTYPDAPPLAQLVLVGEPVLDQHLRDPSLQKLKKRVQLIAKLDTFNRKESLAYIQRKLSKASPVGTPKVFSNAAIHKIVKASNGIPRNLNMLCTDALVAGCKRHQKPISASTVKRVLADFQERRSSRTSRFARFGVAVVILAALAAGVTFRDSFSGPLQMVAQWPQQGLEQVQPLLSDLRQKTESWFSQAPKQAAVPMSVEVPAAVPTDRPSSEALMPLPSPHTTPKPSPPRVMVEASKPSLPKVIVEMPKPAPTEAMVETPSPPHHSALQQVADVIDQHFPKGGAFHLKVWSAKAPGDAYVEDENLLLYVVSETSAFLRIDYYQADGKIVHLLPRPLINNQVRAGERFTLGGKGNAFQFKVAPPFGTEMLTVVASQSPIESQAEAATGELNGPYVEQLSHQLQTYVTQGKAAAAYVRIQTQPHSARRPDAMAPQPVLSNEKR